MKSACVFGGSGFLGSSICDELTNRGYKVTIYDINDSPYRNDKQEMIIGDILDESLVYESIKGKDIVYNMAGIADIDDIRPIEITKYNILGNNYILEGCRKNNVKRFLFASTIYIYSNRGLYYRSSKQACESFIENYNEHYGLPYTVLRYGSLYGPRANEHNSIRRMINQAITENKITRHGDGSETRQYIHIGDASKLSVDVLDDEYENKGVLITGNQSMRIKDIHNLIKEMMDRNIELEYMEEDDDTRHYTITPYTFNPKPSMKLVNNPYHDIGQGMLECIKEEYERNET